MPQRNWSFTINFSKHPLRTVENEEYHAFKSTIALEVALFVPRRQGDSLLQFGNLHDILNTQNYAVLFSVVDFGLMSFDHIS